MAGEDTVASLGFEVDSKPLDDAKQKLKDLSTEAGNTGQAVDKFNQSASKTGDALSKVATPAGDLASKLKDGAAAATAYAGPLGAIEAAAKRSGVSVGDMAAKIAATNAGNNATINSLTGLSAALGTTGGAVRALASEHSSGSSEMTKYREIVHSVGPALQGLGVQLSSLTQFSYAARAGLGVLALAVGGELLVKLGQSRDELEKMDFRLQAFAGEGNGGKIGADLKKASDAAGVMPSQIAPAVESILQLENALLHANPSVIYAPGYNPFDGITNGAAGAVRAVQTVTEQFKLNKLDTADATKATNEFFASIKTNSGLTKQEFDKLINEAPTFAAAFAKAFGANSLYDFQNALQKLPIPLQDVMKTLLKMGSTTDEQFKQAQASSKSFGDSVDALQKSFKDMWLAVSGGDQPVDTLSKVIKAFADSLDQIRQNAPEIKQQLDLMGGAERDFADNFTRDESKVSGWNVNVVGAVGSVLATLGRLPGEGLQSITNWANAAIAEFQRMAAGAISAAQTAVSALANIGSGGPGTALSGNTDALGNPTSGSVDASGNQIQLSGVGSGQDNSSFDFASAVADGTLPAFATGGQLTVTGSGGTDSQLVQFKATPGEVLTVSTPDQMAAQNSSASGIQGLTTTTQDQSAVGVVSATPDPASMATVKQITDAIDNSTIDITKQVSIGSDNIVNTLNKLIGGVAATTVNPATGLPVASASSGSVGSSSALTRGLGGASASGGGGGFKVEGGINPAQAEYQKQSQAMKAADTANKAAQGGSGADPMYMAGYGAGVKGAFRSGGKTAGMFPSSAGMFPYTGGAMPANGLSPFQDTSFPDQSISSLVSDFSGDTSDFSGSLSDIGGGTSDFFGTDSSGSGTFTGSLSDIGTTEIPSDSGGLEGFVDPNSYGYFATGGQFKVRGDGGTDTTKVSFHATKGETVTITPSGVTAPAIDGLSNMSAGNIPSGIAMPQVGSAPSSDASQASNSTNQTMTKNVIINVQAGIQADSFIKSRAQIARGI